MPGGRLLTSPSQLAAYSSDGLGYKTFMPDAVTIPANASELVAVPFSRPKITARRKHECVIAPQNSIGKVVIPMEISPLSRHSLVDEVSDRLSAAIRSDLASDQGLLPSERAMAEQFGVSRPVIREAVKRLEHQGLLEVRQGYGIRVIDELHRPLNGSLSLLIPDATERLRQLHETRLALEPEAARLAALRATPEQVEQLGEIQARLEATEDNAEAIAIDLEFHHALAEASGNLMFRLILDSLGDISRESRERTIGRVGKQSAIDHHRKILDAIVAGDPIDATAAMQFHLGEAWKDMKLEP